jgi:hypothetical protein
LAQVIGVIGGIVFDATTRSLLVERVDMKAMQKGQAT